MPKRTKIEEQNKHEHWAKKSAIVAIISSVITYLGGFYILAYNASSVPSINNNLPLISFFISLIALFVIAVLVDYVRSNLKKVFWIEDIFGGIVGAVGYYGFFSAVGIYTFITAGGFLGGFIVLFVLFYFGFLVGHFVDKILKQSGININ